MPRVHFHLANPYKDGKLKNIKCSIRLDVVQSEKERKRISTDFRVYPKDWDFNKQIVRITDPSYHRINAALNEFRNDLIEGFMKNKGKTFDEIIAKVLNSESRISVRKVYSEWIDSLQSTMNDRTIQKHRSIEKRLVFDSFASYDIKWFESYINDMISAGLVNDTMNKNLGSFKTFFKWAKDRGYHSNDVFTRYKVGPSKAPRNEIVALTESECKRIADLELSGSLDYVRNIFLLSCHSGARWSDLSEIESDQISESQWTFEAMKTRKQKVLIKIPFVGWCADAKIYLDRLQKYGMEHTEPFINRSLKKIGKMAGIDDTVKTTRMSGKNQIVRKVPKYEYISLHTGRRTFISVLLNQGKPHSVVMKLTGISSMKTLLKYLDTSDQDVLREMMK